MALLLAGPVAGPALAQEQEQAPEPEQEQAQQEGDGESSSSSNDGNVDADSARSNRSGSELSTVEVEAESGDKDDYVTEGEPSRVGKTRVPVQDTPQSVTVVDEQFMEDTGSNNIEDALKYSSGVYSGQFGFDNRGDWTAVRGLDASKYLDGLRRDYGFYNSAKPNPYGLESIEVLKGPSSVLYGQADIGGIINAVSKLPQEEQQGELWTQIGSYDRTQVATDVTGPVTEDGDLLYRFVGLRRESGTQMDFTEDNGYLLAPSVTWKPAEGTELTLLFNRQVNEGSVSTMFLPQEGTLDPGPQGQIEPSTFLGEPWWDRYDREKNEVTLFLEQELTEDWTLKATARDTDSRGETREHWAAIGNGYNLDGTLDRTIFTADRTTDVTNIDVRVEGQFDLGPTWHNLAVGVGHQDALWTEDNYVYAFAKGGSIDPYNPEYGNLQRSVLNPTDRPDNEIKQTGVYLIDHMEIGKTVISTALRRDKSENRQLNPGSSNELSEDEETTGRIGLMYRFDFGASPYVSYSESFNPNLGTDGAGGTLDPTTGEQEEAGVKFLSNRQDLVVNFAWFDIEQQDRIQQSGVPGGVTQTGAVVEGWELQAKKAFSQFNVIANYTNLDARDESTNTRLSSVVEEQASVWGRYEFGNGLEAGLGGRYLGTRVGSGGSPEIPSTTLYDAMLGYTLDSWEFKLNAHNLTDEVYVSYCSGQGGACNYGETRNVQANLRYNF